MILVIVFGFRGCGVGVVVLRMGLYGVFGVSLLVRRRVIFFYDEVL